MRKKIITALSFFAAGILISRAQITITQNDIISVGKMLYQADDTIKSGVVGSLDPGPAGANQTWNFTNLLAGTVDTMVITNPAWLPNGANFPTSNLAAQFPDGSEYYLKSDASGLYAVGAYGDPTGQGAALVPINPNEQLIAFPATYNSSFQDTSVIDLNMPFTGFGADSARYKQIKTKDMLIDAWGSITTPLGTFNSLRIKGKVVTNDSIWLHYPVVGWSFLTTGMDSSWHFAWWANNVGMAVLEFDSTEADTIRNISWLTSLPVPGSVSESTAFNGTSAYPNPSSGKFTLSLPNTVSGATAEVYTAVGSQLLSAPVAGGKESLIDLSNQPDGIYFLHLKSKEGTVTRKLIVNK